MELRAKSLLAALIIVLFSTSLYANLVITEIMGRSLITIAPMDWWELTNTGDSAVNLLSYSWDDDHLDVRANVFGSVTIDPGESIIIINATNPTLINSWKSIWGLDASVQIIGTIFDHGLSASDKVVLFNALNQVVTVCSYIGQPDGHSAVFDSDTSFLGFSQLGSFGSWQATGFTDVASPSVAETSQEEVTFDRKIFWTDKEDPPVSKIQRINSDFNDVENILTAANGLNAPRGIDLDFSKGLMYWASTGNGRIYRAKLDGSEKTTLLTIAGFTMLADMELDLLNGYLYYSETIPGIISRIPIAGGTPEIVVNTLNMPYYFDLDIVNNYIYYTDGESPHIWRYDMGTDTEVNLITNQQHVRDVEIDLNAGKLYFNDRGVDSHSVNVANLDGSGIQVLYDANDGLDRPHGLAIDFENDVLYWTDTETHAICKAPADGSGPVETIVTATDTDEPWELVIYLGDADINRDYEYDLKDFALLAKQWDKINCDTCMGADLTDDGNVDIDDLAKLADYWLQ